MHLESIGLPATTLGVDAETGDILVARTTRVLPEGFGSMPITTTYSDYREVHGIRVPYRVVETNEESGRTIYEVENVEVDIELDPAHFILRRR